MPDANITKNALAESMKKLMKEKSFEKISVIDICEGCGMNRKSFYYHFKDKYDLVNWIFYTDFIRAASSRKYRDGWDLLAAIAELFSRERTFYRAAMEIRGQNSFNDYFYESTRPIFDLFLTELSNENSQIGVRYLSDSFLVIMHRWLEEGNTSEPDQFIRDLKEILRNLSLSLAV